MLSRCPERTNRRENEDHQLILGTTTAVSSANRPRGLVDYTKTRGGPGPPSVVESARPFCKCLAKRIILVRSESSYSCERSWRCLPPCNRRCCRQSLDDKPLALLVPSNADSRSNHHFEGGSKNVDGARVKFMLKIPSHRRAAENSRDSRAEFARAAQVISSDKEPMKKKATSVFQ